jgi:Rrf2 family protein
MPIPKRIEYSIRALVALAAAEPATVNARVLADTEEIPAGYLYDVLADLRRVELVQARRGGHGGYSLARPAAQITLGTVVRLLDGAPTEGLARSRPPDGVARDRLQQLWDAANQAGLRLLDDVTLADIAQRR